MSKTKKRLLSLGVAYLFFALSPISQRWEYVRVNATDNDEWVSLVEMGKYGWEPFRPGIYRRKSNWLLPHWLTFSDRVYIQTGDKR